MNIMGQSFQKSTGTMTIKKIVDPSHSGLLLPGRGCSAGKIVKTIRELILEHENAEGKQIFYPSRKSETLLSLKLCIKLYKKAASDFAECATWYLVPTHSEVKEKNYNGFTPEEVPMATDSKWDTFLHGMPRKSI